MATTRGALKTRIWLKLNKTSTNPGFYTDAKLNDAVQEAVDFVSAEMNLADEGFLTQVTHQSTTAPVTSATLPAGISIIKEVRYLVGDMYVPLWHDKGDGAAQYDTTQATAVQVASVYRVVNNALYFNPPLSDGGTNFLEIEGMYYPTRLAADADSLGEQFEIAFQNFIVYKACSILAGSIEKASRPWAAEESQWYKKVVDIIKRRTLQSGFIRDFEG